METVIGMATLLVIVGLGVGIPVYRMICESRAYLEFRGTRLAKCPETRKTALVEVSSLGGQAILDEPRLQISECSRWPMRGGCGLECLSHLGPQPSSLEVSPTEPPGVTLDQAR
jgi:hypothetical protein